MATPDEFSYVHKITMKHTSLHSNILLHVHLPLIGGLIVIDILYFQVDERDYVIHHDLGIYTNEIYKEYAKYILLR